MPKVEYKTTNYNCPIYPIVLIMEMFQQDISKNFQPVSFNDKMISKWQGDINEIFILQSGDNERSEYFQKKIRQPDFFTLLKKNIQQHKRNLVLFGKVLQKTDYKHKTTEQLLELYQEFNKLYKKLYAWGWVPNMVDGHDEFFSKKVANNLKSFLTKQSAQDQFGNYFSILTTWPATSLREEANEKMLKIALDIKKDNISLDELPKKFDKILDKYAAEYGWLTFNYYGPAYTKEDLLRDIKEALSKNIQAELRNIKDRPDQISLECQELIDKLGLPAKIKKELDLLAELSYLKDFRKNIIYQAHYYVHFLLKGIAQKLEYPYELMHYILPQEMSKILSSKINKNEFKIELEARIKLCALVYSKETNMQLLTDYKARELLDSLSVSNNSKKEDDLSGQVSYSGNAIGIVRIVNDFKDIKKISDGDILVSVKTDPTLLPAMKKSGAFVTEVGGITSHAAIVARELQKPCIIGVKNITKILKDGDQVEVDAEQGIIKKIEKK